jgi:hypothetical protein
MEMGLISFVFTMTIQRLLVVVSKPQPDSGASFQQWRAFQAKAEDFLSSNKNARRISGKILLLSFDEDGTSFLRAITESGLRYELFFVWEASLAVIQGFDPMYSDS